MLYFFVDSIWPFNKTFDILGIIYILCRFHNLQYRSSRPEVLCRKGVLRNSGKFTGKHLCQSLFFNKVALTQVFSCEFCKISKNVFFYKTPPVPASGSNCLAFLLVFLPVSFFIFFHILW